MRRKDGGVEGGAGFPAGRSERSFTPDCLIHDSSRPLIRVIHCPTSPPPQMFETGVDEMSWDDLSQGRGDWPPVRALHAYRRKVKAYLLSPVVLSPRPVHQFSPFSLFVRRHTSRPEGLPGYPLGDRDASGT